MNKIYLDNASTTPLSAEVLSEMMPVLTTDFGNPNSLHSFGRKAKSYIDTARERVARALGCKESEVYFTSGATESNNWAIIGLANANKHKGNHIITSKIEHPSVLEACKKLEKDGFEVTYLDVDEMGFVRIDQLLHYVNSKTILISIMSANNEMGVIQNLQAISNIASEKGIIFHTDATQAVGAISFNVRDMGIKALSMSGHKINGPKGVGVLYLSEDVVISPFMNGGEQEFGLRAGTSNVSGIVGLGKAIEIATRDIMVNNKKLRNMRDYMIKQIMQNVELAFLNGHPIQRLPNNINISFGMVDGESLMCLLDMEGIAVGTGSACSSGSVEPSYVLTSMGIAPDLVQGAIRISLSKDITKEQIDFVVSKIAECVAKLRKVSAIGKSQVGVKE